MSTISLKESAALSLIRPIARLFIRTGLRFPEFLLLAKRAFAEAAQGELAQTGTNISVSKLSVVTGLQRQDLTRILGAGIEPVGERSALSRIISTWRSKSRFIDAEGNPRPLTCEGKGSEFALLVQDISKELNHYAVLFEFERAGLVIRKGDQLELQALSYLTRENVNEAMRMVGNDIDRLLSCVEHNVNRSQETPQLHLRLFYDNICSEHIAPIQNWCLTQGSEFIQRAQRFISQFDKDINPLLASKPGGGRVSLTAFSLVEQPVEPRERIVPGPAADAS